MLHSINPFNGELLFESEYISIDEAIRRVTVSRKAFEYWKNKSLNNKIDAIKRLSVLLRSNKSRLSQLITSEMGKLISESEAEIEKCATLCDYYVANASDYLKPVSIESRFTLARLNYEPLGVVMGIMPWNFPFWQVVRFAVPALLSGNVIVLKHASNVSMCSIELQKLFSEACGEADIFQSLLIKADDVASLLQSGLINGVSVTGSEDTGRKVGEAAGRSIIKQVYELGGNDSFIVLKDADIRKSAENAVYSRLINAGQSCISAKRFIVHQSIAEEFLQVVKQQFELRHPGNPLERNTSLAPLAKRAFVDEVNSKLHQARQFGAKALYPLGSSSVFILPNLLSNVNENNPIYDEEIFAPVAILHTFQEDAEAIRLSNSSRYGLSASVWSGDETYATHIAQQLECGSVYINTYSQSDASIPFGGIKFSGYGKEMGKQGLLEFVNAKAIICG